MCFGDPSSIVIDSFVLGLEYLDIMGTGRANLEYELNESLSIDSTYYSFNTIGLSTSTTEFSTIAEAS